MIISRNRRKNWIFVIYPHLQSRTGEYYDLMWCTNILLQWTWIAYLHSFLSFVLNTQYGKTFFCFLVVDSVVSTGTVYAYPPIPLIVLCIQHYELIMPTHQYHWLYCVFIIMSWLCLPTSTIDCTVYSS